MLICSMPAGMFGQGRIVEKAEPAVSAMLTNFVENNKSVTAVRGWRVQIIATTDRQRIDEVVGQFNTLYPELPIDWIHTKPYYKVRVGAYQTKREALRMLYLLKSNYPGAYPVQDDYIRPEELL
ncbi:MAG: hypothetical protein RLY31_1043 [Bacteroidota bacterium]|jgi:hypothetical protein